MMKRNASKPRFSPHDLLPLAIGFVAVTSATFAVSCYAEGQQPIAALLQRAQSKANASHFDGLLASLGKKHVRFATRHRTRTVVLAKSVPTATLAPPQIDNSPSVAVSRSLQLDSLDSPAPKGTGHEYAKQIASRVEKKDVAKHTEMASRESKPALHVRSGMKNGWKHMASGLLHRYGIRF